MAPVHGQGTDTRASRWSLPVTMFVRTTLSSFCPQTLRLGFLAQPPLRPDSLSSALTGAHQKPQRQQRTEAPPCPQPSGHCSHGPGGSQLRAVMREQVQMAAALSSFLVLEGPPTEG